METGQESRTRWAAFLSLVLVSPVCGSMCSQTLHVCVRDHCSASPFPFSHLFPEKMGLVVIKPSNPKFPPWVYVCPCHPFVFLYFLSVIATYRLSLSLREENKFIRWFQTACSGLTAALQFLSDHRHVLLTHPAPVKVHPTQTAIYLSCHNKTPRTV